MIPAQVCHPGLDPGSMFAPYFASPFGLSLSKPVQACAPEGLPASRVSPRRATYFSLLRQRNLRKRKATLLSASLRFATGNLRCSVQPGSSSNSPSAQTIARPAPSGLRSSAQTEGWGIRWERNQERVRIRGDLTRKRVRSDSRGRHVCTRSQHTRPNEVPLHRPAGRGRG
jgi:hypothetical protein